MGNPGLIQYIYDRLDAVAADEELSEQTPEFLEGYRQAMRDIRDRLKEKNGGSCPAPLRLSCETQYLAVLESAWQG